MVLATLAALAFLGVIAPHASAVTYFHPFISAFGKQGTPNSSFDKVGSIAVDQTTHDIYVVDSIGRGVGDSIVYRFTSTGAPSKFTEGPHTGTNRITGLTLGNFGSQLAVAPAGSPSGTAGTLYVSSGASASTEFQPIDIYSPGGAHIGTLDGSGNPNPDSGGAFMGIATDFAGNVYAAQCKGFTSIGQTCEGHIDKYVPTASPPTNADFDSELRGFSYGKFAPVSPLAAGEDSLWMREALYDLSLFPGGKGSADVTGEGTSFGDWDGVQNERSELPYVDPSSGDIYLARGGNVSAQSGGIGVRRYDKAGNLIASIPVPSGAWGVAVNGASANIYVSSRTLNAEGPPQVRIYGPGVPVDPPTASIDAVVDFDFESAHFTGTVNAGGSGEAQETTYRFECTPACPGLQGDRSVTPDGADHAVSDDATGLAPETSYEVTLVAKNPAGEVKDTISFETEPEPTVLPPEVTIDPVTSFTATTAELSGTVDANGTEALQATTHRFEYSGDGTSWIPLSDQGPIVGDDPQAVSGSIEELEPNTTYSVRLRASNFAGSVNTEAPHPSFTTLKAPPLAEATGATSVKASSAQLNARINPRNSQTTYYFQWGPDDCASNPCTSVPLPEDGDAGSGGEYLYVNAQLEGLSPETSYSYRLIAFNEAGETTTPSVAFATEEANPSCTNEGLRSGASSGLPDCRAYEMVSPLDKNGGDVALNPQRSRAAIDGNAVSYASLTAFAGATGINDIGTEYISRRGTNGWTTHGITPQHLTPPIPSIGAASAFVGEFSPDLEQGIFAGLSPIPGVTTDNVAGVTNLYRGNGLGTANSSMALISDSIKLLPLDREGFDTAYRPHIGLGGHSEDFDHVIFETTDNLTSDATGEGFKLYEWSNGTVRLAGILPDESCSTPPCPALSSVAGAGALSSSSALYGASGAYTEPSNAISADGSRIFFTVGTTELKPTSPGIEGELYLRENGVTTMQIDASERTHPVSGGLSRFEWANAHGTQVLFLSTKTLLDEDQDGTGRDLYEYDLTEPLGSRLTLLTPEHVTLGALGITDVVGVSENGRFVYFLGPIKGPVSDHYQEMHLLHDEMVRLAGIRGEARGAELDFPGNWGDAGTNFGGSMLRVSPDGHYALFQSTHDQGLGYDNQGNGCALGWGWETWREGNGRCAELFLYGYATDKTICVSCNPSGAPAAGNASFDTRQINASGGGQQLSQPFSADGRRVFFNSRDALVPEDSNGKVDVYLYDVEAGKPALISSGQCNCDSVFLAASPSGNDVFFATNEQLVARDVDDLYDVYDARVGGGIAFQNQLPAAGCEGDACQAPPSVPNTQTPSSSGFTGPGNPKARPNKQKKKKKRAAKRRKQAKKKHNAKKARKAQRRGRAGR